MISDRRIAEAIVLAQVASDGGKCIPDLYKVSKRSKRTWRLGYYVKEYEIERAIKMILSSKNSSFRFFAQDGDIPGSIIVYFDWRKNGEKMQVSFHTFDRSLLKYSKPAKYATHWDEKSSRNAAFALADFYRL